MAAFKIESIDTKAAKRHDAKTAGVETENN